jgi:phospholipase C
MHRVQGVAAVQNPPPFRTCPIRASSVALALALAGCGGGGSSSPTSTSSTSTSPPPPSPSYTLSVTGTLGTITAGNSATAKVQVSPQNGYSGTVALSCSVSGGGKPAPSCVLSSPSVAVGTAAAVATLTVSSSLTTPGGSYSVAVSARDASGLTPSNGSQTLALVMAATIQHVVIIFQENRTPDNLFHDPVLISRGADIASSGRNSLGQTITLAPIDLGTVGSTPQIYDMSHTHAAFVSMYDGGKMDGADLIPCTPTASCPANPQFMYVKAADVQPYFALAEQYTFGDRMFQTNEGPSFAAHQFILAGTSAPTATSPLFAAEDPALTPAGCLGVATNTAVMIDATGSETAVAPEFPCFEHPTMTDLLATQQMSWRYYTPSAGSIWTAPNAIQHICVPATVSSELTCTGTQWTASVVIPQTQVLTDIANGQLAQVSWVIPDGQSSDHASTTDGSGPSWVASIVNALGNSPYWANTAIIITWDDWGGWYDHVAPTVINDGVSWGSGYVYGFRVPLIVVSPYAKKAYISHVTHDFGSILKFIEKSFQLGTLGYADARADDLSDCFDLTQAPTAFQTIPASLNAAFFINDRRAPLPPDDD